MGVPVSLLRTSVRLLKGAFYGLLLFVVLGALLYSEYCGGSPLREEMSKESTSEVNTKKAVDDDERTQPPHRSPPPSTTSSATGHESKLQVPPLSLATRKEKTGTTRVHAKVRYRSSLGLENGVNRGRSRSESSSHPGLIDNGPDSSAAPVPRLRKHRPAGSLSGKENVIDGKQSTQVHRRPVLANVTNTKARRSGTNHASTLPFPPAVISSSATVVVKFPVNGVTASSQGAQATHPAGLRIELDGKPLLASDGDPITYPDPEDCLIYRSADDFLPPLASTPTYGRSPERGSTRRNAQAIDPGLISVNTSPLRQALAAFGDVFSMSPFVEAKGLKTGTPKNRTPPSNAVAQRQSLSPLSALPAPGQRSRTPSRFSIPTSFKISNIAGSLSQLTANITSSITAKYDNGYNLGLKNSEQDQYEDDAVSREERFEWESEMRALEMQCGVLRDEA